MTIQKSKLNYKPLMQVWHIPQVPMAAFKVDVTSVTEAVKVMGILADYDNFQFEHNVKGDYCNVQGLSYILPELVDSEVSWDMEFFYEGEDMYFDEPKEFMAWLAEKNLTEEEFYEKCPSAYDAIQGYVEYESTED